MESINEERRRGDEAELRRVRNLAAFLCGFAYAEPAKAKEMLEPSELPADLARLFAGLVEKNATAVIEWFREQRAEIGNGHRAPQAAVEGIRSVAKARLVREVAATLPYVAGDSEEEYLRRLEVAIERLKRAGVGA